MHGNDKKEMNKSVKDRFLEYEILKQIGYDIKLFVNSQCLTIN